MARTQCLTPEELAAFHLGELPEDALEALSGHLEVCPRCEEAARALDGLSDPVMAAYRQSARHGPFAAPSALPTCVGDYEILGEVGRGGMGVVYRARHRQLQRTVALKMLLGGTFAHHDERARFHAEAQAVARLQHPHIVQIYEIGEHTVEADLSWPFFTLEFAEGGNLAGRLAGRPQPPRQAAAWLEPLARAAHYAHECGIVHRDLKPSNVLLTADDQPKICDFGIAKFLSGSDIKTLSGTLLGTAEYMAPEQAFGATTIGPAADIYALGAILYTALTGRPPFQGTSALHTLEQVRQQEPIAPRSLQPHVPRDLDTICLKCLEKDPGKRYASAQALADDLRRFLADEPIQARVTSSFERGRRWMRRHKAAASALTGITLSLAAATLLSTVAAFQKETERHKAQTAEQTARAAQERAENALQLAEERQELAERNLYLAQTNLTGLTLDPAGGIGQVPQLLSAWRGVRARVDPRGWEWFYCQTLASRAALTLHGHEADASALAWSPDGTLLASGGFDNTIRLWDAVTGQERVRVSAPWGILALSWSPDGRQLASANWSDKSVALWDPATGKELQPRLRQAREVRSVAFRPDGQRLAVADSGAGVSIWDPHVDQPLVTLQGTGQVTGSLCWSPDGRQLATNISGKVIQIWEGEHGKELARLEGHPADVIAVRWSPDGRWLASADLEHQVRIWDMASHTAVRTIANAHVDSFEGVLCWSPDSRRLAGGGDDLAVRVWDVASGALLQTFWGHTGSHLAAVSWSPDGTRLASSERGWNGTIKVWQLPAASEVHTLVVSGVPEPLLAVCWSPDGQSLATAHQDGTVKTWDVATGRPGIVLRGHAGPVNAVSWSPDGRELASAGSDRTVKRWDVAQGRLLDSFAGNDDAVVSIAWRPNGQGLVWDSAHGTVSVRELTTSTTRRPTFQGHGAAWSPRGDRLAVGIRPYYIRVYDAATDALLSAWSTSFDSENWPAWSPDGEHIASVSDYAVVVAEAATGRAPFAPIRHTHRVQALAWSPDGKQLATATEDDRIHLWDAVTGNPILTLPGRAGPIRSLAWSPDGMRLAFSSAQGQIHIWDATPGYTRERSRALRPSLAAARTASGEEKQALRLKVGVSARLGLWNQAADEAEHLLKQTSQPAAHCFQAGWWIADALGADAATQDAPSGDPFEPQPDGEPLPWSAPTAPRWYLAADDPNGYVPLAKGQPYYLTRLYVPQDESVPWQMEVPKQTSARVWVNGRRLTEPLPARLSLSKGWNTVAVRIEENSPSTNILFRPRAGFHVRLPAQASLLPATSH